MTVICVTDTQRQPTPTPTPTPTKFYYLPKHIMEELLPQPQTLAMQVADDVDHLKRVNKSLSE